MIYPEHIQWIINNRTESLHKALSQDNSYKNIENYFDIFLSADPTSKKKLTQWLVDTYINGGFKWEDIQSGSSSKVFYTLSLYIKHKSKLDSSNRDLQVNANDISQYSSLGSVYEDIAPFIKLEKSSRSVKRENRVRAYEESEVLIKYNDGEFTKNSLMVVIPKTEYASKWWGRGTQWCTAGDKNNMFDNYYKDGPLVVIIVNDIKTQLHINLVNNNTPVQFMNEHDIDINLKFVKDNWTLLSPIMEWAINKNGTTLRLIPELLRTAELCLCAVSKNAEAIRYVPQLLLTTEICLVAVRKNGNTLRFIDNHLMAEEICLEAVRQNGRALEYIPEYLMTHELCLEAVRQNGYSLRHVPESLRIAELCLETVRQNGYYLQYVPKILITAELCLEAVKQDGNALYHVPEALRTEELCLEAVRQNGGALYYVPESLITPELCLEAVKQDGVALVSIPEDLMTAELCLEDIKQNNSALRFIPDHLKIAGVYVEVIRQNRIALNCSPEQYKKQFSFPLKPLWDINLVKELKLILDNPNLKIKNINQ